MLSRWSSSSGVRFQDASGLGRDGDRVVRRPGPGRVRRFAGHRCPVALCFTGALVSTLAYFGLLAHVVAFFVNLGIINGVLT
jgi:hypothetical protein